MSWGYLRLGRIDLRETYRATTAVNAQTGEQSVSLVGTETSPPLSLGALRAARSDLMQLRNTLQPVTFSNKSDLNGYYFVKDVGAGVLDWSATDAAAGFDWEVSLIPFGPHNAVDLESRLTGTVRVNGHSQTGVRWHAPPPAHYAYFTGSAPPGSSLLRVGDGFSIRTYLSLPPSVDPRWGCDPAAYLDGAATMWQGTLRRAGVGIVATPGDWTLTNGILRVRPLAAGGLLSVDTWDSGAWATKAWDISLGGVPIALSGILQMTVTRNEPELVSIRLLGGQVGVAGRYLVDLLLRRGSRFVEVYIQTDSSTTIATRLNAGVAGTAGTGFVRVTANDADGNRAMVGSSMTFTNDLANTGLSKAAVTALDFYLGAEFGGSGAAVGDAAADLQNQYIGALAEEVVGVTR